MFLQLIFCAVIGVYGVKGQHLLYESVCGSERFDKIQTCISNSADFSSMPLDTLISFFYTPTEALCSKKTELFPLLKCAYNVILECYQFTFGTAFLPSELNKKALDYHCSRIDSYHDGSCLRLAIRRLGSCVHKGLKIPSRSNFTHEDVKAFICGAQKNGKNCTQNSNEFAECPDTRETFLNINKFQNPEACGGEAGFERGVFDDGKSTAPPTHQSVVLLTTMTLMKFII